MNAIVFDGVAPSTTQVFRRLKRRVVCGCRRVSAKGDYDPHLGVMARWVGNE
jgi:hypothetical protein